MLGEGRTWDTSSLARALSSLAAATARSARRKRGAFDRGQDRGGRTQEFKMLADLAVEAVVGMAWTVIERLNGRSKLADGLP